MDILQAVILGIVQGITEFLPISSSGHLVLAPWLLGWEYQGASFDVALHVGTLLGVVAYFWRAWRNMIASLRKVKILRSNSVAKELDLDILAHQRLLLFIVLATIPSAATGYFLKDFAEGAFRSPPVVAASLILFSFVILFAEKFGKKVNNISHINWQRALVVGFFQALAIIPGVSRSGATISAALFLGLSRVEAARFSFLLATPIIVGAGLFKLPDIFRAGIDSAFIAGLIASALFGYYAIKFLFKFLEKASYMIFVWYRIILGLVIFGLIFGGK